MSHLEIRQNEMTLLLAKLPGSSALHLSPSLAFHFCLRFMSLTFDTKSILYFSLGEVTVQLHISSGLDDGQICNIAAISKTKFRSHV